MSLADLTRTEFPTDLGVLTLWHGPDALQSGRPVLIVVTGAFASDVAMSRTQGVVGPSSDVVLMHLPGNHSPPLRDASVPAFAAALQAFIDGRLGERPVVLAGVSIGALVALAVRSAAVRRVVAIEPPLVMRKLWPMRPSLANRIAEQPDDADLRAFADHVFGVTPRGFEDRDYFHLFEGLDAPVDVVIGDEPLMPERVTPHYPSFVDEPERAFLRGLANVVVRVAPGAGHNVPFYAPLALRAVLLEALLAVGGLAPLSDGDKALLGRAPIDAEQVLYVGGAPEAFAAAYARRNPTAALEVAATLAAAPAGPFNLVLLESVEAFDIARLASIVTPAGSVVAVSVLTTAGVLDQAPFGVVRLNPPAGDQGAFDDRRLAPDAAGGLLVVLARRRPLPPPMLIRSATFAPTLMDIRTRLPAQAMRSDPELVVSLCGPAFEVTDAPFDAPKVLILQRPALVGADAWRQGMAAAVGAGWLVVTEFDDHPVLVAEVKREPVTAEVWRRFGYVHAVQTSTPRLAAAFAPFNPEVKVFANCAFELEPFPRGSATRRIFYGAVSRGAFAVEVAATLGPVAEAFPDVEWVVVGDDAVFAALPAARKQFVPYVAYDEYLRLMGTCQISLSPIEGRPFQDTKSDAKFVEAASRGVLTVASPTIYAETIRHGENGLIAGQVADWAPLLTGVLSDEPARWAMARTAWDEVRATRMFAQQLPGRRAWYRDLWDRREALNAALMSRLPGLREALGHRSL